MTYGPSGAHASAGGRSRQPARHRSPMPLSLAPVLTTANRNVAFASAPSPRSLPARSPSAKKAGSNQDHQEYHACHGTPW